MKIALIYFGQPRFVNNSNCIDSQRDAIMSQSDCDVFAHLWEPSVEGYNFATWSGLSNETAQESDIETFIQKWSPKKLAVEPNREFGNEFIYNAIQHKLPGGETREYNFNLCLSQLYSIEKAICLYEDHIKESGDTYDFVIFMRTDLCVWGFPNLSLLEKGKFYFSDLFHQDHFADLCYVTDPKYVSGLKCYSYLTDESLDIINRIPQGNAESIKKATFVRTFGNSPLAQAPLHVRVVRNNTERGSRW